MDKVKSSAGIQEILSIGYVYLVVMGILNQSIFYTQIGVNILDYSSILDVLIIPISTLTSSTTSLLVFFGFIVLTFVLPMYLVKKRDKGWFKKTFKIDTNLTMEETQSELLKSLLFMLTLGLFGFYVGGGVGRGIKISVKIQKGEIFYNDHLKFIDGKGADVNIIGTNSTYVFYLEEGNKNLQISPINGAIRSIENNKEIKKE